MKSLQKWMLGCLALAAAACGGAAMAATETVDSIEWTYTVANGVAAVGTGTSATGAVAKTVSGEIAIPAKLGGLDVTSIRNYAFAGRTGITAISIPGSVTNIGSYAFQNCTGLGAVRISDLAAWSGIDFGSNGGNPLELAHELVLDGTPVRELSIPEGVERIGQYAFSGGSAFASISIPDSVVDIGTHAFDGCSGITEAVVPDSVQSMGWDVFSGCRGLRSLTIPFIGTERGNDGVATANFGCLFGWIWKDAAGSELVRQYYNGSRYCDYQIPTNLTAVVVTDETLLGHGAFQNCTMLTNIVLNDGIAAMGAYAFGGCTAAKTLNIPGSVTNIGSYAFQRCYGLTEVEVPKSVQYIGQAAFWDCWGLKSLALPFVGSQRGNSMESGSNFGWIFRSCARTDSDDNAVNIYQKWGGSYGYYLVPKNLASVTITDETVLGYGAFQNCTMLANIAVNDEVATMGDYVFDNCTGLTHLPIPKGVKSISPYAFRNCRGLETIELPETVEQVGNYAFGDCTAAKTLNIQGSVTNIGNYAFQRCYGLTEVEVPKSVQYIGQAAFWDCWGLKSLALPFVGSQRGNSMESGSNFGWIFRSCARTDSDDNAVNIYQKWGGSYGYYLVPKNLASVTITDETVLGYGAFQNCTMLTNVTMNAGVEDIGAYGFSGCTGLVSIVIPETVRNIGSYAFQNCTGLTDVRVLSNDISIDATAFSGCPSSVFDTSTHPGLTLLDGIVFSAGTVGGVVDLSDTRGMIQGVFRGNTEITRVILPEVMSAVPANVFYGCTHLGEIEIPGTVSRIGDYAFYGCKGLRVIAIPEGVARIGEHSFQNCTTLAFVSLPATLRSIGVDAFEGDTQISTVAIPDLESWLGIEFEGFASANPAWQSHALAVGGEILRKLVVPENVTQLHAFAFCENWLLSDVALPEGLEAIPRSAFNGCRGITNTVLPSTLETIGIYAFQRCAGLSAIDLPVALESIENYAFNECTGLRSVTVPPSLRSIGNAAFNSCTALEAVNISDLAAWCAIDFGTDGANPLQFAHELVLDGEAVRELVVPEGVEAVKYAAFYSATNLTGVSLPSTLTTIGDYAFAYCSGLTRIEIPEGVANIGANAFLGCSGLAEIVIPQSVASIGQNAFNGCADGLKVTIAEGATAIPASVFAGCAGLASIDIPATVTAIGAHAFDGCTGLRQVGNLEGVTDIADYAFRNCKSLAVPGWSENMDRIGAYTYWGCTNFRAISLPGALSSVGACAFAACSNLASVTMPVRAEGWTNAMGVASNAFGGDFALEEVRTADLADWCRIDFGNGEANPAHFTRALMLDGVLLENLVVPDGIQTVRSWTFSDNAALKSAAIPDTVTHVQTRAFQNCTGLTEMTVPDSVQRMEFGAFRGCVGLRSMTLPFVGVERAPVGFDYQFGILFAGEPAEGTSLVKQHYDKDDRLGDYYIPTNLVSVAITDETGISKYAFENCWMLKEIQLNDGVADIGTSAFANCSGLERMALPASVAAVAEDAFRGCAALAAIEMAEGCAGYRSADGVLFALGDGDGGETAVCCPPQNAGAGLLPGSVARIAAYAFEGCGEMESLSLPAGVTNLPLSAFAGTTGMERIDVPEDNPAYTSIDGVVFTKDGKTLVLCPRGRTGNYAVPDGVMSIADSAFAGCARLNGVAVPGSVADIGAYAFDRCVALTSVELEDGLLGIGGYAFRDCSSLASLTIPDTVETLGKQPFQGCDNLVNLVVPEGLSFGAEEMSGTIYGERTLSRGTVYEITGNLTVANGATLTIPSGVILKFREGVGLTVNSGGTLNATGTRAAPVVFTSVKDDAHGGDTNGDGGATVPQAGDWTKIRVSGGRADFDYAKILYSSRDSTTGAINMSGGSVTFLNGEIAHCAYDAVGVESGSCRVENTVIRDCLLAFRHWTTNPVVNCVIYDCGRLTQGGGQHFYNCVFSGITEAWEAFGFPQNGTTYDHCCFWNEGGSVLTGEGTQDAMTVCGKDGNVWGNPLFADPDGGDFRLQAGSPCIDAGNGTIAPALDWYGQPRMEVAEVPDTGTSAADGAVPDIGIHEYLPRVVASDVDLAATGVEAPEKLTVGERVEVSWRVRNIGSATAAGPWTDVVELVGANGAAAVLGRVRAAGELVAGGERVFTGEFTVPASAMGRSTVRVTANGDRDLFEGTLTANNVAESAPVEVDLPELAVTGGETVLLTVGAGSATAFRVPASAAPGGGVLVVRTTGNVDIRTGNGVVPTADIFHAAGVQIAEDTWVVALPEGASAVYATLENAAAASVRVEISVQPGALLLFDTAAVQAVNEGTASVPLSGNGFVSGMSVWIEKDGAKKPAGEVVVTDAVRATAMFDVTGLSEGLWSVHVERAGLEASADLLSLSRKKLGPKWRCDLDVASAVRSGREYVGYVEYANDGDVALDAPFVKLDAKGGTLLRFSTADAWGDTLELMAVSESYPASRLKPGESRRIPFRYKTTGDALSIEYGYTLDDASAFPWDETAERIRPSWAGDELWGIARAILEARVGATWNDYLARMRADCDELAKLGRGTHRLDRVWQQELNAAMGVDVVAGTLESSTDLARAGRGFGVSLARSYGAGVFQRLRKGVFGYGWADNHSFAAELSADGKSLTIRRGDGAGELYVKAGGRWSPSDPRTKTVLAEDASAYVLTYRDGTTARFPKDGMRLASLADRQGNSLSFEYGAGGLLRRIRHADGQSVEFAYSDGLLVSATDDQGRTVRYEYAGGQLAKATAADGLATAYEYHPADGSPKARALTRVVRPDGTATEFAYGEDGFLETVSWNGGKQTARIRHDGLYSHSVTAPDGGVSSVQTGWQGEILRSVGPTGSETAYGYAEDDSIVSVAWGAGKRSKLDYDEDGQLVKTTDAAGASTGYGYDPDSGNLARVADALGNGWTYGMDRAGNPASIEYADGAVERFQYSPRGDITNAVNRRGQAIAYAYDVEGRLVSKTWEDGRTFTWAYDARGNCTNAADSATGSVAMEYDAADRLVRIIHPDGRGFAFEYDAFGRLAQRTALGGTDSVPSAADIQRWEYDAQGRLARLADGDGNPYVENTFDDATGRLVSQRFGNGTVASNEYDRLGRTVRVTHFAKDGSVLDSFACEYDAEGRKTAQTSAEGTVRYAYDLVGQLTDAVHPGGTEEHYRYDAAGNRTEANGAVCAANALNQYTAAGDETFAYDADGNLVSRTGPDGTTVYAYDPENRLVGVTNETLGLRWSCEYDVFGDRVRVCHNGTTVDRLYDLSGSVAAEFAPDGAVATRHVLLGGCRIADVADGAVLYRHADESPTARMLTDSDGRIVARASYRAFGEDLARSGDAGGLAWNDGVGVERDPTGLLFMRNRYYDPALGRFLQQDILGINGGDVNLYRYCGNDSIDYIDPEGLATTYGIDPYGHMFKKGDDGKWIQKQIDGRKRPMKFRKGDVIRIYNISSTGKEYVEYHVHEDVHIGNLRSFMLEQRPDDEGALHTAYSKGWRQFLLYSIWSNKTKLEHPISFNDANLSSVQKSIDPNEMSGPLGAGEARYVKPGEWLDYTIYFENQASATAAAQEIRVTLGKDAALDWDTLELGEVAFGTHIDEGLAGKRSGRSEYRPSDSENEVRTTVSVSDGAVEWYLRSWTAKTADHFPEDFYAGILPPNDADGRGEGHLRYRVKVRDDAAPGTVVRASASIVFDYNAAIETDPAWWNTVAEMGTATVDLGDGTETNVTVMVGAPWGDQLPDPGTREDGLRFAGWFTGPDGTGSEVTAESLVVAGTKLYAYWTAEASPDVRLDIAFEDGAVRAGLHPTELLAPFEVQTATGLAGDAWDWTTLPTNGYVWDATNAVIRIPDDTNGLRMLRLRFLPRAE